MIGMKTVKLHFGWLSKIYIGFLHYKDDNTIPACR